VQYNVESLLKTPTTILLNNAHLWPTHPLICLICKTGFELISGGSMQNMGFQKLWNRAHIGR
jgi:hypothetical protein